jgi:hypothetical protein
MVPEALEGQPNNSWCLRCRCIELAEMSKAKSPNLPINKSPNQQLTKSPTQQINNSRNQQINNSKL